MTSAFIKKLTPHRFIFYRLPSQYSSSLLFTFDDGPDEILTPIILDILDEFDVKAIFFMVGYKAKKFPKIVKMVSQRGHVIGNHTYLHPNLQIPSFKEYRKDIIKCQDILYKLTGITPRFFRPPKGIVSFSGLFISENLRLRHVLWSIEGGEWGFAKDENADVIAKRLKKYLRHRDIILLHDNNRKIPEVLKLILPWCKSRDFDLRNPIETGH